MPDHALPPVQLNRRVLIVDDNADLVYSLRMLLEKFGCQVDMAFAAEQGILRAVLGKPDLIFLDLQLPKMNGYQAAQILRLVLDGSARLIALTAYGFPEDRALALAAGFDDYFLKPAAPERLLECLLQVEVCRAPSLPTARDKTS